MKLVSFETAAGASFGVVNGSGVVDAGKRLSVADLKTALAGGFLEQVRGLATQAPDHDLGALTLLPVIPNPDKILCVGANYVTHRDETGRDAAPYPILFSRNAGSQVGHGQPMLRPGESVEFDFEGELALVIGQSGRRIPKDKALAHVAGYACYNDGTIRDWQRHSTQFTPGKNFDRSGAFGPWLVTADEIPDPRALSYQTRLNGEVMQAATVSDLIFDIPTLIAYISTFTTLLPGDVIVTGTAGGVGAHRKPPVWMKPGDVIEVEFPGVGLLRNTIADERG